MPLARRILTPACAVGVLLVVAWPSSQAVAQQCTPDQAEVKLRAAEPLQGAFFGNALAFEGDTLVVGSPFSNLNSSNSGAVHVFRDDGFGFVEQQQLTPTSGFAEAWFGVSVALSGDTLVVGAHHDSIAGDDAGAAYVFTKDGNDWMLQAVLTASDAATGAWFGGSVDVDGDRIAVSAPLDVLGVTTSGSVYVFERVGTIWTERHKLQDPGPAADDFFGASVALDGDTLVIGSPDDTRAPWNAGVVHVFVETGGTWTEQAILIASNTLPAAHFGARVALQNDVLVVTDPLHEPYSPWHEPLIEQAGTAYVFTRSGDAWTERAILRPEFAEAFDWFGTSAALLDDLIVIGSRHGSTAHVFSGADDTWTETALLQPTDFTRTAAFGRSVALTDGLIAVGALGDDELATDAGAVYLYCDCDPSLDATFGSPRVADLSLRRLGADPGVELSWADLSLAYAGGVEYEIAIGTLDSLQEQGAANAPCVMQGLVDARFVDSGATDPSGDYYLVRGIGGCGPSPGTRWGTDSFLAQRPACP